MLNRIDTCGLMNWETRTRLRNWFEAWERYLRTSRGQIASRVPSTELRSVSCLIGRSDAPPALRRYAYEKRCKCDDSLWVYRTKTQRNIENWFLRWEHYLKKEAELYDHSNCDDPTKPR